MCIELSFLQTSKRRNFYTLFLFIGNRFTNIVVAIIQWFVKELGCIIFEGSGI